MSECDDQYVDSAKDEAKFKVGDQWFYRGNRSPSWFFVASRADGSCQDGICERVPKDWWPLLEEIAALKHDLERAMANHNADLNG